MDTFTRKHRFVMHRMQLFNVLNGTLTSCSAVLTLQFHSRYVLTSFVNFWIALAITVSFFFPGFNLGIFQSKYTGVRDSSDTSGAPFDPAGGTRTDMVLFKPPVRTTLNTMWLREGLKLNDDSIEEFVS